jgi:hypothetical protein
VESSAGPAPGSRFIDDLPREPVADDAELEAIVTKANATDGRDAVR